MSPFRLARYAHEMIRSYVVRNVNSKLCLSIHPRPIQLHSYILWTVHLGWLLRVSIHMTNLIKVFRSKQPLILCPEFVTKDA